MGREGARVPTRPRSPHARPPPPSPDVRHAVRVANMTMSTKGKGPRTSAGLPSKTAHPTLSSLA